MKLIHISLLFATATLVFAQRPMHGGKDGFHMLGFDIGGPGQVVKNAPFTGSELTTETQTLPDGNKIVHTVNTQLYRDSEGRTRIERTFNGFGPWGGGTPKTGIEIHDPVAGVGYILNTSDQTALKSVMHQPSADQAAAHQAEAHQAKLQAEASGDQETTENLGTQTIAGLPCTGTRTTRVIAAGKIGNQQPITVTKESWLSTDLQIVVQSKRVDPRMGEVDVQFQNITRGNPDASLFQVPTSYTVTSRQHGHSATAQ